MIINCFVNQLHLDASAYIAGAIRARALTGEVSKKHNRLRAAMSISFKSNLPSSAELSKLFGTVATFDRYKIGDRVVTAGTTPILKRARELAPRDVSGHGKKRGKKQKAGSKWDVPLWTTVNRKVVKWARGAYGIIGPSWPEGTDAYFDTSPNGRKVFYWGKNAGKIKLQIRNWIVQAADETRPEQLSAMEAKLKEVMAEVILG